MQNTFATLTIGDFIWDIYLYPDKVLPNQEHPRSYKVYVYRDNIEHYKKSGFGVYKPGGAGNFFLYLVKENYNLYNVYAKKLSHYFLCPFTSKSEAETAYKACIYNMSNEEFKCTNFTIKNVFNEDLLSYNRSILPEKYRILNKETGKIYIKFRFDYEFKNNPLKLLSLEEEFYKSLIDNLLLLKKNNLIGITNLVDYDKYVFNTFTDSELSNILKLIYDMTQKIIYVMAKPESAKLLDHLLHIHKNSSNRLKIIIQVNEFEYQALQKFFEKSLTDTSNVILIITKGSAGADCIIHNGNESKYLTFKQSKPIYGDINTSGAGDVFGASFINMFLYSKQLLKVSIKYAFLRTYEYLKILNSL